MTDSRSRVRKQVTIPNSSAETAAATPLRLYGMTPVGVSIPSSCDSVTALTFEASFGASTSTDFDNPDVPLDGDYQAVYDSDGTELSVTVAEGRMVLFTPSVVAVLRGAPEFVRVKMDQTATADRLLSFVMAKDI